MAWFAVYQTEDGRLVSGTSDATKLAASGILAARGYAIATLADGVQNGVWNTVTHSFDPAPANPVVIDCSDFFDRFTGAELKAILASTDANVIQFVFVMQRKTSVDLTATRITTALTYLVNQGLLTAGRAVTIRTP